MTSVARAHVSLETQQAQAGAAYKAMLRLGRVCCGSATHTLSVSLPAGFRGARPMPKSGWVLSVQKAPLAQPYNSHGRQVTEDAVEITRKTASREAWLADADYDEFVPCGQALQVVGPVWFKVQQLCEQGQWGWFEMPATGTSTRGLKAPAAVLEVLPAAQAGHAH